MFALLVLLGSVVVFSGCQAGWHMVWSDEFNGNNLNDNEWYYEVGGDGWGNEELEFYTKSKNNARVENGHLVIDVKVENFQNRNFTSARLNSKKAWTYGKFEARAKLPKGKQLLPAIWMMPKNNEYGSWAASGEIDIMEVRGDNDSVILGTLHYGGVSPNNTSQGSGEVNFGVDFSCDYHTFGLEWDKNEIRWYVDGYEYYMANINRNMWSGKGQNPYNYNGSPFDKSFFWILNIAVSGTYFPTDIYGPPVTPTEAKHWAKPTMEIDYIRVYQKD